jgi:hypothetical protein
MSALVEVFHPHMVKFLPMIAPVSGLALVCETYFLRELFPTAYENSPLMPGRTSLPKAFAAVILCNVVLTCWNLLGLGFRVSSARTECAKLAKEEGDEDAEKRYSVPKLYAEGFSETAEKFNNVQRGHQQALETVAQFIALSLIAGTRFPISAAVFGFLWNVARVQWANGYKISAKDRYGQFGAFFIWIGLFNMLIASIAVSLQFAGIGMPAVADELINTFVTNIKMFVGMTGEL